MDFCRLTVGKSNEKNRDTWLRQTLANLPANSRILDAGAGTQCYRPDCSHLQYVSQDFAKYDGTGDTAGLQVGEFNYGDIDIISDIASIPEPAASFDAIMCTEVLEHLPNPLLAISEFSRLLKPGGCLILTAPFCSLTHFSPFFFNTGLSRYWYEKVLVDNGFTIVELTTNGNYFEYLAQEIGRVSSMSKRYANTKIRLHEKIVMQFMKYILQRLSDRDTGSQEILCFGHHVLARKS